MQKPDTFAPNAWLIACIVICVAGLTHNITGYSLFDPDEGRNAEVMREMVLTGDYVLPHLNGLPYLDKPVLYFAAGALLMKLFGPTAFAARLPSLLFTLATLITVGLFARRLYGPRAGITAAIATAATPFTLAYARIVIFDSALTFFVVLALVCFYLAMEERLERGRLDGDNVLSAIGGTASTKGSDGGEGWTALAWVAIGFGVLTKGPIAIVLPLLIALPFAIRYRAWRSVLDPIAILLFAVIVSPWVVAVSLRKPDFLEYVLITETARRFSTTDLGRTGPIWYFLAIFPAAALPWSLALVGAGRKCLRKRVSDGRLEPSGVYLLLWIFVPLLFFTLSQSKRPQYVLPMVPAAALLIAASWRNRTGSLPGARWAASGLLALGLFFVGASGFIQKLVPASPDVAAAIPHTALVLGTACLVGGLTGWIYNERLEILLVALSLPVAAIPFSSHNLMREIGNDRSAALIAQAISEASSNTTMVVGVGVFPPSLPFYLGRTVIVATADGAELTSNYLRRHVSDYRGFGFPLRRDDWWKEALVTCTVPTVFVAAAEDADTREALGQLSLIIATDKYAAYGPCGLETMASGKS